MSVGQGGDGPLLPWKDDFAPTAADREYAERFHRLDELIERSEHSEDIVLRLSTCRNQWLSINAIFVDLREALGAAVDFDRLPENLERAWRQEIQRPLTTARSVHTRVANAVKNEYLPVVIEARKKRRIWDARDELDAALESAVENLPFLDRDHARAALSAHREGNPVNTPHVDGRYLGLANDLDERGEEALSRLADEQQIIHDAILVGQALVASLDPLLDTRALETRQATATATEPAGDGVPANDVGPNCSTLASRPRIFACVKRPPTSWSGAGRSPARWSSITMSP